MSPVNVLPCPGSGSAKGLSGHLNTIKTQWRAPIGVTIQFSLSLSLLLKYHVQSACESLPHIINQLKTAAVVGAANRLVSLALLSTHGHQSGNRPDKSQPHLLVSLASSIIRTCLGKR